MREVKTGEIYRHFKGNLYQVVAVALHSETEERYVVYQALYGDMQVWIRPYDMFVGEIDHDRYPDAPSRYRFELVSTLAGTMTSGTEKCTEAGVKAAGDNADEGGSKGGEEKAGEGGSKGNYENADEGGEQADERLLRFLDADSYQEKINYLALIKNTIDDRLINDIAAAMDIAVDEGALDARYNSLKNCLMTKAKYECGRR